MVPKCFGSSTTLLVGETHKKLFLYCSPAEHPCSVAMIVSLACVTRSMCHVEKQFPLKILNLPQYSFMFLHLGKAFNLKLCPWIISVHQSLINRNDTPCRKFVVSILCHRVNAHQFSIVFSSHSLLGISALDGGKLKC